MVVFMLQAKGYARTNGNLTEILVYGDVSTVVNNYICDGNVDTSILIGTIFYSVNMLVIGAVTKYFPRSLQWLHAQDKQTQYVFAVILMLVNCLSFTVRIIQIIIQSEPFLVYVLPFMIFSLLIEVPFVIYHTCKITPPPKCNCLLHFLACCHIIWFTHSFVTDALIATFNFVVSPAQTMGAVTVCLSVILGAIITLKFVLSSCAQKKCLSTSFVLFMGICAVAMMICIGGLYIIFVSDGLNTSDSGIHIGGTILSFAPPIIAPLILGAYAKKVPFLKKFLGQDTPPQPDKQDGSEAAVAIQVDKTVQEGEEEPLLKHVVNIHAYTSDHGNTAATETITN